MALEVENVTQNVTIPLGIGREGLECRVQFRERERDRNARRQFQSSFFLFSTQPWYGLIYAPNSQLMAHQKPMRATRSNQKPMRAT